MFHPFLFKELFEKEVKKLGGGMASLHAHLDRAFSITEKDWEKSMALMEEKWILVRDYKKKYNTNPESLRERLEFAIKMMMEQGITACRTHVDIDSIVGHTVAQTFAKIRDEYKDKFTLQLAGHPLEGFLNENNEIDQAKIDFFEKGCEFVDVIGGLPSRDRKMPGGDRKHLDITFGIAKNLNKPMDCHIDQENNPDERDSEMLIEKVREHKYEGRVNFLHVISLSAQPKDYRERIIAELKDIGAFVTVCPRAALTMKQLDHKTGPIHNSIAPVPELIEAGVTVAIGADNISDHFVPDENGDLFEGMLMMASACRYYHVDKLAEICVANGQKIINTK